MKKMMMVSILSISALLCASTGFADPSAQQSITVNQSPPGLHNNATVNNPYGLQKQNKRPSGWDKGKKCGWSRNGACVKQHKSKVTTKKHRGDAGAKIKNPQKKSINRNH